MPQNETERQTLESVYAATRKHSPGVPEIAAEELLARLGDHGIVLVDVREERETAVSMIPGSITAKAFEADAERYRGKTIVPYCTIGGRSGMYARQLHEQGWNVLNLKGAILAWTVAGGELQAAGGPTRRVHTNSNKFAPLVAEGYEAVW